jgi:F0F1-type ATP synthase assembly protein I
MNDRYYYLLALRLASDLTVTIALPAVLGAVIGTKIDSWLSTKPWGLLLCLAVAAYFTYLIIKRKAQTYLKLYEHPPGR